MKIGMAIVGGVIATAALTVQAQGINDAQIASIVVTANQVDVDAGRVAEKMGSGMVKDFGRQMVKDHTDVNSQAVALAGKLHVTPEDNPTSMALKDGGVKNVDHLKMLKGKEFDKAYIDHEVAYHEQVLKAVDETLIPGARNEELKALLVKVRPAFAAHLAHAKMMQSKMMTD